MLSTKAIALRVLPRTLRQTRCPTARRSYATDYEKRTQETLKTSSRLTWLTSTAALGAAALYYITQPTSSSSPSAPSSSSPKPSHNAPDSTRPGHRHEAAYASDVPKPVEDRHGDSVMKHSTAAHKNQMKVRTGKFSGEEFDNHEQKHSPGEPGGDFEKK
ncbi:hypothetical protein IQ07DRAFT_589429 [Pyrenochaeta sp. DS3sAY3a]|nr:hypothetical protein IQ07DRAFT_589429 [Pyrenochaeta sp. DS3sAY3a]